MFQAKKEQGFIIRKGRNIQSQKEDRRKFMSQTDFFKKHDKSHHNRSPGSILRLRFKEDIGVIKSSHWNLGDEDSNPEFSKFKYTTGLKNRGDQFDENSFDQFQMNSKEVVSGVDIQGTLQLFNILKRVSMAVQNRSSSTQILTTLKQYFDFIQRFELIDLNSIALPPFRKKTLKDSLIIEGVSLMMISFVEAFELAGSRSFAVNLINYAIDNILLRSFILTKGENSHINELLLSEKKEHFSQKGYDKVKNNNEIMSEAIHKIAKGDNLLSENLKKMMKMSKGIQVREHLNKILSYYAFFLCAAQRDQKIPFLAVAPSPFLQKQQKNQYTLVIDLLQVCGNKNRKSAQVFRPYAEYFLSQMSKYYEIVSLSDAMPNQIDKFIDLLDRKGHVKHRLYRFHLDKTKSSSGKDLSRLGRKRDNIVCLDTKQESDRNTIVLSSWKGKKNDAQLAEMCPVLAMIAVKKMSTQKAVRKIKQKIQENHRLGLKYLNCGFDLQ